ncbi:MAG TPA: phosphogluconate dehydratase [Steroidobacteraceae bacterium]|nr:phosphogluconate dehydratase [Steroidobacteraceae bacterium]
MSTSRAQAHPTVVDVTRRIIDRSRASRTEYLQRMHAARHDGTARARHGCANLAHGFAGAGPDKTALRSSPWPDIAIVSAYNDMLSAHKPYERYPPLIRAAARDAGAVAQFAGGVPAMCDGVTQGTDAMDLSLFSRDTIAMATAIALSHNMFDAALLLGICDKIVPGLFIGAAAFGHLPVLFVPGGPMPSGIPNPEKSRVRNLYAQGKATREELLEAEAASYHDEGTCTFYGTANSNQMMMEVMGLHLPGAAFVPPHDPLRDALTIEATRRAAKLSGPAGGTLTMAQMIDERSVVNAIVGLMATGGSTNHTIHLVAMAHAMGIHINWDDFNDLSAVVPLLARIYPNGKADVNNFHVAGGMAFLVRELLDAGLLHEDITTVFGGGLRAYAKEPWLGNAGLAWRDAPEQSRDTEVLRGMADAFSPEGGLKLLRGNLGRAVIKVSAVRPEHQVVEAPAQVFTSQQQVLEAFRAGHLERDVVVVLRGQGPRANGMPELHKLTPALSVLQAKGHHVALVTDGRMSGASGVVPSAIHVSPESVCGGPLGRVRDGDLIRLDAPAGRLEALVGEAQFAARPIDSTPAPGSSQGCGRELFATFRAHATDAESGARACNP